MGRPNDRRNFVHKRLLSGIKSFVSSGFNPLSGVAGFLGGGGGGRAGPAVRARPGPRAQFPIGAPQAPQLFVNPRAASLAPRAPPTLTRPPARAVVPRTITARPSLMSAQQKNLGRGAKFPGFEDIITTGRSILGIGGGNGGNGGNGCVPPLIRSPLGNCIAPTSPRGAELFEADPIIGQYGAGFIAGSKLVDVAQCPANTVLGTDGICYNKTGFPNKNRMWPAGSKPLLTGGEMGAITKAARAGRRLEGATKRLQRLGMMKKPATRRAAPHAHARAARDVVSVPQ